jgi:hypothetical protein
MGAIGLGEVRRVREASVEVDAVPYRDGPFDTVTRWLLALQIFMLYLPAKLSFCWGRLPLFSLFFLPGAGPKLAGQNRAFKYPLVQLRTLRHNWPTTTKKKLNNGSRWARRHPVMCCFALFLAVHLHEEVCCPCLEWCHLSDGRTR